MPHEDLMFIYKGVTVQKCQFRKWNKTSGQVCQLKIQSSLGSWEIASRTCLNTKPSQAPVSHVKWCRACVSTASRKLGTFNTRLLTHWILCPWIGKSYTCCLGRLRRRESLPMLSVDIIFFLFDSQLTPQISSKWIWRLLEIPPEGQILEIFTLYSSYFPCQQST